MRRTVTRVSNEICQCGHARTAHEHYRPGTDCALCGVEVCRSYDGPGPSWWLRLLPSSRRATGRPAPRDGGAADGSSESKQNSNVHPLIPKGRPST